MLTAIESSPCTTENLVQIVNAALFFMLVEVLAATIILGGLVSSAMVILFGLLAVLFATFQLGSGSGYRRGYTEGRSSFERALKENDRYADAYYGKAEAHRALDETEAAIAAYEGYLARAPDGPEKRAAQLQIDRMRGSGEP